MGLSPSKTVLHIQNAQLNKRKEFLNEVSKILQLTEEDMDNIDQLMQKRNYKIEHPLLGSKNNRLVVKSINLIEDKRYAIKIDRFFSEEKCESLIKEFKVSQQCKGKYTLVHKELFISCSKSTIFTVTELCPFSLEGYILKMKQSKNNMRIDYLIKTCLELAQGLESIHNQGVVLLNIKPSNIYFSSSSIWKFSNFSTSVPFKQDSSDEEQDESTPKRSPLPTKYTERSQSLTQDDYCMIQNGQRTSLNTAENESILNAVMNSRHARRHSDMQAIESALKRSNPNANTNTNTMSSWKPNAKDSLIRPLTASSTQSLSSSASTQLNSTGTKFNKLQPIKEDSEFYMSPEQINNENVNFRSDIYSLGIVFMQLIGCDITQIQLQDSPKRKIQVKQEYQQLAQFIIRSMISYDQQTRINSSQLVTQLQILQESIFLSSNNNNMKSCSSANNQIATLGNNNSNNNNINATSDQFKPSLIHPIKIINSSNVFHNSRDQLQTDNSPTKDRYSNKIQSFNNLTCELETDRKFIPKYLNTNILQSCDTNVNINNQQQEDMTVIQKREYFENPYTCDRLQTFEVDAHTMRQSQVSNLSNNSKINNL